LTQIAASSHDGRAELQWNDPQVSDLVMADGRRLELTGVLNLRDLGGYPLACGGSIRWRRLFRSDALHQLDAEGAAVLTGLGIRSVVDLRTDAEAEVAPSALTGVPAAVTHISLLSGDLQALPLDLEAIYQFMITECGPAIAAAIRVLCVPGALPALVHCSAGKDRTGVVVALMLAALGVSDEVVAADYALSAHYLDPERTPVIGHLQASTGLGENLTVSLLGSPPELILSALSWARDAGGSVAGYLEGHGLPASDLAQLRTALMS
jgi:protein-tyrosine phosphatase